MPYEGSKKQRTYNGLSDSDFRGEEPVSNKNRGVSKPNRGSGPGNAAPSNASNSASPSGGKNLLRRIRGSKAFKSGMGDKP